ncbi:MAG: hypothetical protein M0R80_25710 [Proteobacteria bacterium]|jgi:hypothetical protein|nr:hypothetical protein [Pseudomonadota bacterium]
MDKIEVFPIGTKIMLGDEIPAIIIGVWIEKSVQYHVVWWSGRERKCEWVSDMEFSTTDANKMTIGFSP